eukprot:10346965-Karenia_brevis.AAC.1
MDAPSVAATGPSAMMAVQFFISGGKWCLFQPCPDSQRHLSGFRSHSQKHLSGFRPHQLRH